MFTTIPRHASSIEELLSCIALDRPLVILDLETTGTNPDVDLVVEVAILRIEPDGTAAMFQTLVNPGVHIPESATEAHGITDADVADAPDFVTVARSVYQLLKDAAITGYNLRRFDLPLLDAELKRANPKAGLPPHGPVIDVFGIFRRQEPRDLAGAVRFYLGRPFEDGHRAHVDVLATTEVFGAQLARYPDMPRDLAELAEFALNRDPSWFDDDGKIVWQDGEARLSFGKYEGRPLRELVDRNARREREYIDWIAYRADGFSARVREMAVAALAGCVPYGPPAKTWAEHMATCRQCDDQPYTACSEGVRLHALEAPNVPAVVVATPPAEDPDSTCPPCRGGWHDGCVSNVPWNGFDIADAPAFCGCAACTPTEHVATECRGVHEYPGNCMICDGGLFICSVCGLAEGSLTTHCPGERQTAFLPCIELHPDLDAHGAWSRDTDLVNPERLVYVGMVDFRRGTWVPGAVSDQSPQHSGLRPCLACRAGNHDRCFAEGQGRFIDPRDGAEPCRCAVCATRERATPDVPDGNGSESVS